MKQCILFYLSFLCCALQLHAQQLAFPSAEGFGRYATGGRGGTVYHVTNLNDTGPGSFRDAVSEPNRTVVFDVGGVINITSRIIVSSNITIAGQTAPGEGITIYGNGLSYSNANNTITRYIRYRMGKIGDSGKDAIAIADGHDMIFDHVSITWGRDGTFDLNGDVGNVTLQNSIVGQGLQTHSTGGLIQSTGGVSVLRCLYIDNHTRNPKVKGYNQYINNVIYDWAVAGYILGDSEGYSEANVQNNYFIEGPETSSLPFNRANENFHLYATNNYWDSTRNGILDGAIIDESVYGPVTWSATPFDQPTVTMLTPQEAYNEVFANVGASLHRDQVDSLLIAELASLGLLGQTISDETSLPTNGPGVVAGGPAYPDTDGDGMPDYYEQATNLDSGNATDGNADSDSDGFTNLEEYLNCLAGDCDITMPEPPARAPQKFNYNYDGGGNPSWEWFNNWDLGYLPASGDTVVIQTGEAAISGNKSGITTYVNTNGLLNVVGHTELEKVYLNGGSISGNTSLVSDVEVIKSSQVKSYGSGTLTIEGKLSGDEEISFSTDDSITLNTSGESYSGKITVKEGILEAASSNALGAAYVEVKSAGQLNISNPNDFEITFLEIEDGGKVHLDERIVLSGGKFGETKLRRARTYNRHNMPEYITGNGSIKMSRQGSYDCTANWNGTAYRDDCLVCVEGTTDRQPCDTSLETGVYSITSALSGLCLEADTSITQQTCTSTPAQAIEIIKVGSLYKLRQLQSELYILPFAYENGHIDPSQLSLSPWALGYYRLEKKEEAYSFTPALRPDDLITVEDSSLVADATFTISSRIERATNQLFQIAPYYDCSGELGGLAEVDSCGFCAGGNTGVTPCTGAFEAEEYCLLDGFVEEHPDRDYSGDGYLNYDNAVGTKATYNLVSTSNQTAELQVRYGNGSSNRPLKILVNGDEQLSNVDFPSTGDWNNWEFVSISLDLVEGDNYVAFVATSSSGAANIDKFAVFTEGISLGSCPPLDCFGTPNGTAYLDSCGFCVGGNTGADPCVGEWEAEEYCELDGVLEAIEGRGYSGDGYLNYDNIVGSKATYNVISPIAQSTTMRVRYANGSGNRPLKILVNGAEQISQVDFPATGGWADWEFANLPLSLDAGENYIEMVSITSAGAANIDLIIYTNELTLGGCPEIDCNGVPNGEATVDDCGVCSGGNTGIEVNECYTLSGSREKGAIIYYPNRFESEFYLESDADFEYQLYDQRSGKLIESGQYSGDTKAIGQNLDAGYYILRAVREKEVVLEATVIKN